MIAHEQAPVLQHKKDLREEIAPAYALVVPTLTATVVVQDGRIDEDVGVVQQARGGVVVHRQADEATVLRRFAEGEIG
jgi:hypothetical protein